ncbi:Na+/H+ antiporter [Glacieibacterium megasporae]|uniref:Na+/H+ antiporter n=1 Tax=Glacieibacterium megasporae TaxID=2835787 RepID=UPI001C1DCEF6|nr:Na+/H+ antiporter [Polymorphobacter megasporae]UAJ10087.1 Na+/H+ antiporter [Polymorphobacter megasporae]
MLSILAFGAVLLAVTALADAGSGRLGVPQSIVLVLTGAAISIIPGLKPVTIKPDFVMLVLLPPLLYSAGVGMSWRGFRDNLRPILLLAIGCVLFTASAVAAACHFLLGMNWAVGFVLGAVVAPPDAVAPMAIARRLHMPQRLLTILEGEGLVNDATALILFAFAVGAVTSGGVSVSTALASFAAIVVGELAWGLAVAWTTLRIRRWAKSPQSEIILALLTPFLAFWPPHALGGSGVLAAVAAGLFVSWNGPRLIASATRLQGYFVWGLVTHAIEGLLFMLIGLQAKALASGLSGGGWQRLAEAAVVVTVVVVVVRFIWVFPATYLPRLIPAVGRRDPNPRWQMPFLIGFTGIRGVVSLAAALAIPRQIGDVPFPERDLILFVTFVVIMVTLIGQGALLPPVIKALGLADEGRREAADAKKAEVTARLAAIDAVLAEIDHLDATGEDPAAIEALRRRHGDRRKEYAGTADDAVEGSPVAVDARLQARLIEAERDAIAIAYRDDAITDDARRRIERELDLEDARNLHALESATGDRLADPESEVEG